MPDQNQDPETINLGEPEGEIHTVNLWVRLGNYIIDQFFLSYLTSLIYTISARLGFSLPVPIIFKDGPSEPASWLPFMRGTPIFNVYGYLILYLIVFLYYFIFEGLTSKTIGKMITRTIVVNRYAEKPLWSEIAIRSICRIIPLEMFSFIPNGIGWHDRISQTYVKQVDPLVRNF